MSNGSGLSRGDRNRNARLARLRELVPLSNAIGPRALARGAWDLITETRSDPDGGLVTYPS